MILNFEPRKERHSLKVGRTVPNCMHNALTVHPDSRTVTCDDCKDEVDPIEALLIVCRKIWWQENGRERELEYEEKRVSKVQAAAIMHLYKMGITPEIYAERWAREDARVKEAEAKLVEQLEASVEAQRLKTSETDGAA